jgi:hypothetical protein
LIRTSRLSTVTIREYLLVARWKDEDVDQIVNFLNQIVSAVDTDSAAVSNSASISFSHLVQGLLTLGGSE